MIRPRPRPRTDDGSAPLHLLDATMLYTPAGGGVMRYLSAKRRWLAAHTDVRHTLLVPGARDGTGREGETYLRAVAVPGIRYRIPARTLRWSRAIASRGPDLVEVGDAGPVALAALRARGRSSIAVVAFCHSDVERSAHARYGGVAARAVRRYARGVYVSADRVIAPSEYMRRRLDEWGVHGASVCPLGVDLATFEPSRRDPGLRARLDLAPGTRLLVYAGRFAPEKRLETLAAAFARLGAPYHLLLVGEGPLPPLPSNATVLPFQPDARALARLIASADAFVHAGDQETFGLAYVEAMACGIPVVATADGAAPEIVDGDCGFVVEPAHADAFADAIVELYGRDPSHKGRAARRRAVERYGWDAAFARLLDVYGRVAGARAAFVSRRTSPSAQTRAAP